MVSQVATVTATPLRIRCDRADNSAARVFSRSLQTSSSSHATTSTASATSAAGPSRLGPLLPAAPPALPTDTPSAIQMIAAQSTPSRGRYVLARLHARTYLLHPKDVLTVPTLKPISAHPPGTTLNLTRILEVGSREFAIRSPAAEGKELRKKLDIELKEVLDVKFETVPDWVARCELTVIEHTKNPLEKTLKKKRRKGYQKLIQNKQGWTRLRVGDIHMGEGTQPTSHEEVGLS